MPDAPAAAGKKINGMKILGTLQILCGALFDWIWFQGSLLQIQTTEAWLQGGPAIQGINPNWSILQQPISLLTGTTPVDVGISWWEAWIIEVITILVGIGFEAALHGVFRANKKLGELFGSITLILIAINGLADFQFGSILSSTFWGHFAFSVINGVVVFYFGIIGISLIEHGFHGVNS